MTRGRALGQRAEPVRLADPAARILDRNQRQRLCRSMDFGRSFRRRHDA